MRVERARARASGSGAAIARFLGYSSPKIICTIVATASASTVPMLMLTAAGTPTTPSSSPSVSPTIGSATKPTSRPVTVMPSCAPESMNEVRSVILRTRPAVASPASACAAMRLRSTDMYENSWATK